MTTHLSSSSGSSPTRKAAAVATAAEPAAGEGVRVLVSGAEPGVLNAIRPWVEDLGGRVDAVPDLPRAARALATERWDAVIAVLRSTPDDELTGWVELFRGLERAPRLVVLAPRPSMGLVLRGEQLGVLDVLSLPPRRQDVVAALERLRAASAEIPIPLPEATPHVVGEYAIVGESPAMLAVYKMVARVAASDATVLLEGQSGTGKEVVARALHANGPRGDGPFVAVNCAAIPENLLESELFGHEKGAFTGALARKIGRFEQANGGTLLLDEIGDMSLALQSKILRAVQERVIDRVGGDDPIPVHVRLIAATQHDLREAIAHGRFREDLYYRLAVVTLHLPRLADRGDDLLLLASHLAGEFNARYGKHVGAISDRAFDILREHAWVGNVRELRNVIERAVIVASGETILVEHLPDELRGAAENVPARPREGLATLVEVEARHIARVLAHTNGHVGAAAAILGVHRNTLARKIREHGL